MLIRHSAEDHRRVRFTALVCEGEIVGKTREVDEMSERELVLVVSVRYGKERDTGMTICLKEHKDAQSLSFSHACSRDEM